VQKGRSLFVIILALGAGSLSVKRISTSGNAQGLDLPVDDYASGPKRFSAVKAKVTPHLKKSFQEKGLTWGSPIFIRAFKEEKTLELWVKKGQEFTLFRTYPIAAASGKLGPKQSEGDRQVPEGFYFVKPHQMNPQSNFHLSFNIGYPNAFDKAHNRSGSFIMIHGSNVSLGCLAMTNARIEEIYTLAKAAFKSGQLPLPHDRGKARSSHHKFLAPFLEKSENRLPMVRGKKEPAQCHPQNSKISF
jgi:murein L,D-transpeptidase YafK